MVRLLYSFEILHRTFVLILLFIILGSFPIGLYTFFSLVVGDSTIFDPLGVVPIFFGGVPQVITLPFSIASVFVSLWIIYLILIIVSAKGHGISLRSSLMTILKIKDQNFFSGNLISVVHYFSIFSALLLFMQYLQDYVGLPTGSLPLRDGVIAFTALSLAPIVEEVGFRLTIIGLFSALFSGGEKGLRRFFEILWRPSIHLKTGRREIHGLMSMSLLVFSSLFFGWAHYAYGTGWDLGKITTATVAGFALGWIYIRQGFIAAVLLHWAFNYYGGTFYYLKLILQSEMVLWITDGILLITGILGLTILVLRVILNNNDKGFLQK